MPRNPTPRSTVLAQLWSLTNAPLEELVAAEIRRSDKQILDFIKVKSTTDPDRADR